MMLNHDGYLIWSFSLAKAPQNYENLLNYYASSDQDRVGRLAAKKGR